MKSPIISVYIANHNYEQYVEQSIESVLSQTYSDYELLVIDDGSTDDSRNVINRYRGRENIRIIYQKNRGLNATNNVALMGALGTYIMRLDADDFLEPDALAVMVEEMDKDPSLGLVFPDYFIVNETGEKIARHQRHDFSKSVSLYDQPAHGACTMIRTQNLKELGGYNESLQCQDGYDLWIRFIQRFKVKNIGKPLFSYRRHGKNLTSNEEKILQARIQIHERYTSQRYGEVIHTIGIIPVRNNMIATIELDGKCLLDRKIDEALKTKHFYKIIVTTPDNKVIDYMKSRYKNESKLLTHYRTEGLGSGASELEKAIKEIVSVNIDEKTKAIAMLSIEFPFIHAGHMDDAINAMFLFDADSLISVREDNSLIYQHDGNGMKPLLGREKFTKIEREALYRWIGGVSCVKKDIFDREGIMTTGKVGHIVIDQKASIGIFSSYDLKVANLIAKYL